MGILHKLYEEFRDINTFTKRKKELQAEMIELSLKIKYYINDLREQFTVALFYFTTLTEEEYAKIKKK